LSFAQAIFVALGCGEDVAPPRPVPAKLAPAAPPAEKVEVPPLFTLKVDDYTYNPVGKRDPFKVFTGDSTEGPFLQVTPLERFDLGELKLTAIVWGISNPRALVLAPDGQSYIVRRDMRIGKNRGRVSRITRRQLFVKEEYRDPTGKLVVRESELEIRPKEPEVKFKMSDE